MKPAAAHPPRVPPSLKHPGRWVWLVLAIPAVLGIARLRFDVEVFGLLPSDIPTVRGLTLYQEHFANARELILTLKAADAEQAGNAAKAVAEGLRQHSELVESVTWQPPWLEHPEQSAELMAYLWFNQPPAVFNELTNRLAPARLPELLAEAREELSSSLSPQEIGRLSYDPFGFTRLPEAVANAAPTLTQGQESFSSEDGRFWILFVQSAKELRTYRECEDWLERIKRLVGEATQRGEDQQPVVKVGYTGRPAFVSEVARGMERDFTLSVCGTAVIIAVLFWLAHRRIKPLLWLLTLLAVILGGTLALGGLIYSAINVISVGFAAILLGLAVDYAVVHYQEALAHPNLSIPQIRHAIAPSILWAGVTTIAAFLVLNLGGLPGLGQLGTLVGLGVALAATVMIFEFLPPLFPGRNQANDPPATVPDENAGDRDGRADKLPRHQPGFALAATAMVIVFAAVVLGTGIPGIDTTASALRPRGSKAYAALSDLQGHLSQKHEPLWLIVGGETVAEVARRLDQVQVVLDRATTNQVITDSTMPTALWPRVEFQSANRATALELAGRLPLLRQAALTGGFTEASLGLAERMLETWRIAGASQGVFWPTNPMSRWIFGKVSAQTPTNYLALGLVTPAEDASTKAQELRALESMLPNDQVWLSGWRLLGSAIFARVKSNMWRVIAPMALLVLLSLSVAFRRSLEILLSLGVLLLSGLCVLAVMRLAGWSWNLLNLMAIPLVLGTGVDYSLFMLLALRRHRGDQAIAYRSVGRALLLCGGTGIAGFGALAFSSNAGMASLGQVCAIGIAANMLIAIFLLPTWWKKLRPQAAGSAEDPALAAPSSLYRSEVWRFGLWLVRTLPQGVCEVLAKTLASLYWALAPHRRKVVLENLLPACHMNRAEASRMTRSMFRQFALKVTELWRFEAGLPIEHLFGPNTGWQHFQKAQDRKRGILLLTAHLGNWEFGGPLLTQQGVGLQVITLAEPGREFTRLRQASRARWRIETLVVGDDPLAFVEVIQRLESGATVALLVDRPPPPTAITVELFGRPFAASIAAAELARASGCVLLPVYLPRVGRIYGAHILPPVDYERSALRDRNARRELTQRIMRVFEPLIRKHPDQWYHFVPVWPKSPK